MSKEILSNGWAIVDLSDRLGYEDRKGIILGVEDDTGRLLCSYSSRNRIAKYLDKNGVKIPHVHKWRKNGTSSADNQQWRCTCGQTKTDGTDGRGAPHKYEKSSDRFKQINRNQAMKTYTFKSFDSYSDHPDWDEKHSGNFSEFPTAIVLPNGDRLDPIEEVRLAEKITSAGYAVTGTVRIRITYDRCPNYSHGHHGTSRGLMEVRSALPLTFEK